MAGFTGATLPLLTRPFKPTDIGGCILWVAADKITGLVDGDPVPTWTDLSGSGNSLAQGTSSKRPTFKVNIQNGKPVLRFATDDQLDASGSISLLDGCTVFVVTKVNSAAADSPFVSKNAGDLAFLQWNSAGQGLGVAESSIAFIAVEGPVGVATWQVAEFTWDGVSPTGTAFVYRNGSQLATGTYTKSNLANNATLSVGVDQTTFLNGDIAEVVIYSREVSSYNRSRVRNYLSRKYAVTVTL